MTKKVDDKEEQNIWWKYNDDDIIVYTDRKTKLKFNRATMAEYFNGVSTKPFARQWRVRMGSMEQKALFKELGISDKNEIKPPRKKRESKKSAGQE